MISKSYLNHTLNWWKVERWREGPGRRAEAPGAGGAPSGWRWLPLLGSLFSFCPHLKEIYPKAVASNSGFWQVWVQIWPFLVFERECVTLEKQKILLSACLNSANRPGDGPEGWWAQRTWMISCNFDLFHMSISKPAFWDWLPCLFYKLILISIPHFISVEKKSFSCLNSCLCGPCLIKD